MSVRTMDDYTFLCQQAALADEECVRQLQNACQNGAPAYVSRHNELERSKRRQLSGCSRTIDKLIAHCYPPPPSSPHSNLLATGGSYVDIFNWAVFSGPLSLDILLRDLNVFLAFEEGFYLHFWQVMKNFCLRLNFKDENDNCEFWTAKASDNVSAQTNHSSYWPI